MSLAAISLAALGLAVVLSCTTRLNVGLLSLALAWIIGVYLGGMKLGEVLAGFPVQLFLTLAGVTLLFAQAQANGTLEKLSWQAVRLCRGNSGLIPVAFFLVAAALASIGPGNIATAALIAPIGMSVAARAKIPLFLMALMVGNGANAGSLSPFAPTGVIVNGLLARIGISGYEWRTYLYNLAAHAAVAFAGYLLFGGWRLFARRASCAPETGALAPFDRRNWITLAVIAALIAAVLALEVNVGMAAFCGAVLLILLRAAPEGEAIARMPWGVILMVSGVTVLIALLEKTQGMELFTGILARFATRESVTGMIAF
ncbi:MAG: C4-dicarboxylate ABC transporter, partial [Acidobacteria bacterium]|nr:C4-dicarboxylate ABC transporter [Acidobacteriota bacterium]